MTTDKQVPQISARGLNRATLGRQLLLERAALTVPEAVRRVVALQAQEPASPYLALWNRLEGFEPAELDAAFAERVVVKSNAVRMTLHAVHANDWQMFREGTEPTIRASRLFDKRFQVSGLSLEDADALVPDMLDAASEPRTAAELRACLETRLGGTDQAAAWWGLRQYAPLWHAPLGPPWAFGTQVTYVAPQTRPRLLDDEVAATALQGMVLRYMAAYGPSTLADAALFLMVQRSRVRAAVTALGEQLVRVQGPGGSRDALYDVPGGLRPDEETPAPPRLLGMWDNVLLAHTDRSRVIPPEIRPLVQRVNGDVLPTLLVDGYVAGVWRAVDGGIEATTYRPIGADDWAGLAREAQRLLPFLAGRQVDVYRRYNHWWEKLPAGVETRLLT